jgi:hypothetical protein
MILEWMIKEMWYVGNKRFSGDYYTVIRGGQTVRHLQKCELVCGDILVINRDNPYVPEDCLIIPNHYYDIIKLRIENNFKIINNMI